MEQKNIAIIALFGAVMIAALMVVFNTLASPATPKKPRIVIQEVKPGNSAVVERASLDTVTKNKDVQSSVDVVSENVKTAAMVQ